MHTEKIAPPGPGSFAVRVQRVLLACGAIAALLFVIVFLIEGATRPDYSPLRDPVSSLALGDSGWMQRANFFITGVLLLAFALGLRPALRRYRAGFWAPLLIGLVGVGLVGAGAFVTDPISRYPPGTPMTPQVTTDGALHNAFSTPVFTALPAACFVLAYRFATSGRTGWAGYSIATAIASLIGFVLTSIGFAQNAALMPIAGLLQRLTLIVGLTWIAMLALHLLRQPPDAARRGSPPPQHEEWPAAVPVVGERRERGTATARRSRGRGGNTWRWSSGRARCRR